MTPGGSVSQRVVLSLTCCVVLLILSLTCRVVLLILSLTCRVVLLIIIEHIANVSSQQLNKATFDAVKDASGNRLCAVGVQPGVS